MRTSKSMSRYHMTRRAFSRCWCGWRPARDSRVCARPATGASAKRRASRGRGCGSTWTRKNSTPPMTRASMHRICGDRGTLRH